MVAGNNFALKTAAILLQTETQLILTAILEIRHCPNQFGTVIDP